jgi:hypothetical protein
LEDRLTASSTDRNKLENTIAEYQSTLKHFEQFTYVPLSQSPQELEASIKELESDIKKFAFAEDSSGAGEGSVLFLFYSCFYYFEKQLNP